MRIWDIVDNFYPDVQITEVRKGGRHLAGIVSSGVKFAFAMHLVIASAGSFRAPMQGACSPRASGVTVRAAPRGILSATRGGTPSVVIGAPARGAAIAATYKLSDEPLLPVRSSAGPGERFHGKHGELVVLKGS